MPLTGNASAINTTTTTASGFIADAKAEQVPMNAAAGNQVLRSAVASTGNLNNNNIAATQPMPAGISTVYLFMIRLQDYYGKLYSYFRNTCISGCRKRRNLYMVCLLL